MNWLGRSRLGAVRADDATPHASSESGAAGSEGATGNRRDGAGAPVDEHSIVGDRGVSSFSGIRSLQSRATNALAIGLMSALGVGLLGWYYAHTVARPSAAKHAAQAASQTKAEGDLPLPPLGKIDPPRPAIERVLGAAPIDLQPTSAEEDWARNGHSSPAVYSTAQPQSKSVAELSLERRLGGPVSVSRSSSAQPVSNSSEDPSAGSATDIEVAMPGAGTDVGSAAPPTPPKSADGETSLAARLRPSITPAVAARILPTQRLLIPKGAFIDCTLETAINSALPGITTCVTATDTFGADGQVVLLERGTKLTGETAGTVQSGAARVFVLWTEARTPTGVVIPLGSPGTDELGRAGLTGRVNRHFWQRFGAAILITMIDGAVQGAAASQRSGGTVIYNPSSSQDITTEVLKSTVGITPTIEIQNGNRIQILVARDLDFRSVYELKPTAATR
ncbi:MAG: type IV secretion system protein VirB10 [Pseudomonadota bacterium]|nr:type IV secretion system protein VirB10 [Pseudomonadota bacterium]